MSLTLALLAWGTLVGLDLVSLGQVMISRPLVAGTVAGALAGDVETGLRLGLVFELFQFDVMPVGAARYPEYGPATVAAVAAAHFAGGTFAMGLGAGVGLLTGLLGGVSLHLLRRWNTRAVQRVVERLEVGDSDALARVHLGGIARDATRAVVVTGVGLTLAELIGHTLSAGLGVREVEMLGVATAATAVAVGAGGVLRLVGRGTGLRWLTLGLASGAALAWWR